MATTIVMPQMGYDMQEGTVVRWRKQEGETVARGDIIAEIETDKATVEYEAFTGGVLGKIVAQEGAVVPVGELIAVITDPGEAVPDDIGAPAAGESPAPAPAADGRRDAAAPTPQAEPPPAAAAGDVRASPIARRLARERGIDLALVPGTGPGGRIVEEDVLGYREPAPEAPAGEVRASPLARRLARERGIDLARITGTGPGGRIVEEDVLGYQEPAPEPEAAPAEAEAGEERVELSRMRRTIARVTSDSKRQAPHFYVTAEVDMTRAAEFRREVNDASSEVRVSVNDLIVKAASIALGRYPKFNSSFQDDHLRMNSRINVGIAIALEDGLIVPGIDHCESKGLLEIAVASSDLISRANSGDFAQRGV